MPIRGRRTLDTIDGATLAGAAPGFISGVGCQARGSGEPNGGRSVFYFDSVDDADTYYTFRKQDAATHNAPLTDVGGLGDMAYYPSPAAFLFVAKGPAVVTLVIRGADRSAAIQLAQLLVNAI